MSMLVTLYSSAAFVGFLFLAQVSLKSWHGARAWSAVALGGIATFALKCLLLDLLVPWGFGSVHDGPPLANLQSGTAAVTFGALFASLYFGRSKGKMTFLAIVGRLGHLRFTSIDVGRVFLAFNRAFGAPTTPTSPSLPATAFWWAVFALGLIAVGFRFRSASLRFAGLGLFSA